MKNLSIVLIVLGLIGFGLSMTTFKTKDKIIDAGPIEVNREKSTNIPIPPILSGVVLAAGVIMLISARR